MAPIMKPHTTIDVVIILVIFLALLLSLILLAWRHPTSLSSLRAVPVSDTALPTPNTAAPLVHSHGRSFASTYLRNSLLAIYPWWDHASHNNNNHNPPIAHYEHPVARPPPVRPPAGVGTGSSTRASTPGTLAFTYPGASSSINTAVDDNDEVELHKLDGSKGPSTSSLAVSDNVDITHAQSVMTAVEPIVSVDGDPTIDCATAEVDITDFDKVAMARQSLQ